MVGDTVPRKRTPVGEIDWEARRAFGQRVKQLRDQLGWTTERFAETIGVSTSTLESWMYRRNPPEPEWKHKARVAEVAKVSLHWLETGEEDGKPRRPGYDTLRADVDKLRGQVASQDVGRVTALRAHDRRVENDLETIKTDLAGLSERLGELAAAVTELTAEMRNGLADLQARQPAGAVPREPGAADSP